jgi:hypothetical protein
MSQRNFHRSALFIVFVFCLAVLPSADARLRPLQTGTAAATGDLIDRSSFRNPPMDFWPMIRWWWPGGDVDDNELAREISVMKSAGFGSAEIQSFAVGLPSDASSTVFTHGTPQWFDHLSAAVDQAQSLGFKLDLTLGSSWPSGGANVSDSQSLQQLVLTSSTVTGPTLLNLPFPIPDQPQYYTLAANLLKLPSTWDASKMTPVAAMAVKMSFDQTQEYSPISSVVSGFPTLPSTTYLDSTSVVDLSRYTTSESKHIVWPVPSGSWMIFALYSGPTGQKSFYGADPNGALVLDHLSASATQSFLDTFAGAAANRLADRFGTTLRSLFVDSLELRTELFWTNDFLTEFRARRGYDLQPFLPILFRPYQDDSYLSHVYPNAAPRYEVRGTGPRVRHDYNQTVSELMTERFFATVGKWGSDHGVTTRTEAFGAPVDLINASATATIPETEDLYAEGTPAFLKLAASAAHAQDKNIVSSEAFQFRTPDTTPGGMLRLANRLFAAGVNLLLYHGFPYVYTDGFAPKTWVPFNSPYMPARDIIGNFCCGLNDKNPMWTYIPDINQQVSRTQLVLRMGRPVQRIALYTNRLGYPDDTSGEPAVNHQIERSGQNYDYVNDNLLQSATVQNNQLLIGPNSYSALILDNVTQMTPQIAQLIQQFSTAGVPIVLVGDVPYQSAGYLNSDQNDAIVQGVFRTMLGRIRDVIIQQAKVETGSVVFISDPANLGTELAGYLQIDPDLILSDDRDDIHFTHRQTGSADYYFFTSSRNVAFDTVIAFNNGGRFPQIFNVATGDVVTAPVYAVKGARTVVPVHMDPGSAIVVGFEAGSTPEPPHIDSTDIQYVTRQQDGSITGSVLNPGTYSVTTNQQTINVSIGGASLANISLPVWNLALLGTDAKGNSISQTFSGVSLGDISAITQVNGFSGVATYTTTVNIDNSYADAAVHPFLDLGQVYYAADLKINGRFAARLLSSPFQKDLHDYLTPGANQIEVDVSTGGSPGGVIGPAFIIPSYQVNLSSAPSVKVPPVPISVVVTPPNFPNSTLDDMYQSIARAAQLTNHVNFQWYWQTPPSASNPHGGATVDCDSVALWVKEARRLNLGVTLQFQVFVTQVQANGTATVRIENPLVPDDQATFGDQTLAQAYIKEVTCLAALEPEYLVLGPEVNFLVSFNYPEFQLFQPVYLKAYDAVKATSPWTQVGLSWQYDGLRNSYPADKWNYIRAAGPQDFIGLTTYFGYSDQRFLQYSTVGSIPADYYAPIRQRFPSDPIVFTEVGYSSAYPNGLTSEADFITRFPALVKDVQPTMATWALLHDVNYFTGAGASLNQSGLLYSDDSPKPVWNKVMDMKTAGATVNVVPQVVQPRPLPFSVTSGPPHFPTTFTQQDGFDAIALGGQVGGHISMQFAWKDNVTGQVWNCEDIAVYTNYAKQLGLKYTIQFNTYATKAATQAGANPVIQLLTPVTPANANGQPLSMGMPEVHDAYVKQVSCLAGLKPEYLVLGPEVNFLLGGVSTDEFIRFAAAYQDAYAAAKAVSPSTQIGVSYQYDAIRNSLLQKDQPWYIPIVGTQDFIGLTSYFSYSAASAAQFPTPLDVPRDYYDLIPSFTKKPIVFTEVGWGTYFMNGNDYEVSFLNRLPSLMTNVKPANVIWALLHDTLHYFKDQIEPLNYFGLRMNDGTAKPAWDRTLRLKQKGLYTTSQPNLTPTVTVMPDGPAQVRR